MASRILTCVSCTFYFCILITITIVGFASFIVGTIGVGLYIPTSVNYDNYKLNNCTVINVQNNTCTDSCYHLTWTVEYRLIFGVIRQYIFSTITKHYDTPSAAKKDLNFYVVNATHSCYYDETNTMQVQWSRPSSPKPYLIMIIVGFGLTAIYLFLILIIYFWRSYDPQKANSYT